MVATKSLRDLSTIDAEIAKIKEQLENVRGTETEVYARIVGYYRSVRNWNKGKRDEYNHRKQFVFDNANCCHPADDIVINNTNMQSEVLTSVTRTTNDGLPVKYEFFARKTCPNCPPVKEYLANTTFNGVMIDVDTEEGLSRATELGIFAAPTVVFFDNENNEISRCHTAQELAEVFAKIESNIAIAC